MPACRRTRDGSGRASFSKSLGLGDRLTHRPSQLSGGQQQRVSIARALMNGGQIILADEPTGALDSKSGAEVMALLEDLAAEGHTVILITHDASVAAHANRVIEIKDGEITKDSGSRKAPALEHIAGDSRSREQRVRPARCSRASANRSAWRRARSRRTSSARC